jgi:uncharacterized membrane protein YjgN (DUF898 family)
MGIVVGAFLALVHFELMSFEAKEPGEMPLGIAATIALGAATYLAMGVTFLIVGTWYQSKFWRFRAAHTQCEGLRFAMPNVSTGKLMRLLVGNWVLGLFSLGLLAPLVMQRSMRFWCHHLEISGTIDLQSIAQAERGPRTGEGLAGFFDIDVG